MDLLEEFALSLLGPLMRPVNNLNMQGFVALAGKQLETLAIHLCSEIRDKIDAYFEAKINPKPIAVT